MQMIDIVIYLSAGAGAGLLAGLLGVGGGLIIVPILLVLFAHLGYPAQWLTQLAVGTSLATIVATGISSTLAHHRQGAVDWLLLQRWWIGICLGAVAGAYLATCIDSEWLKKIIGGFALLVSAQLFWQWRPAGAGVLANGFKLNAIAGVIGGVSSLIGIGGGSLTVPYLLWAQYPVRRAIATSAACGVPIGLAGACAFVWMGWQAPNLPAHSWGFVVWPAALVLALSSTVTAQWGAKLAHQLPVLLLKRIFAGVLCIVGVRLLLS